MRCLTDFFLNKDKIIKNSILTFFGVNIMKVIGTYLSMLIRLDLLGIRFILVTCMLKCLTLKFYLK